MAFPVPEHLPRHAYSAREHSFNSSSTYPDSFLHKISQVSWDTLNSGMSSSWVEELSNEINDTKAAIRDLVNKNLPDFERQLQSSDSIQDRIRSLSKEADHLTSYLHDPQTGLLPTLTKAYGEHATLAQDAEDANVLYMTVSYALRCRDELNTLTALVADAKLAESVTVSYTLGKLLQEAPSPLPKSKIFSESKHKYRVLADTAQEQLGEAYSRSVHIERVSDNDQMTVTSPVPILRSSRNISLSQIFESLAEDTLTQCLRTLQKSVLARFVEPILSGNSTATVEGSCLTISPHPAPNPINSLSIVKDFVQQHIFAFVPPAHLAKTMSAFYQPLASSLLDFFRKTMPDSLSALPTYLQLAKEAVEFERSYIRSGISTGQRHVIAEWADSVQSHYEKHRRENILEAARRILSDERKLAGTRVEKEQSMDEISVEELSVSSRPTDNDPLKNRSGQDLSVEDDPPDDPWDTGDDVPAHDPWDTTDDTQAHDPWDDGWDEPFTSDLVSEPTPLPPQVSPTIPKSAKGLEKFSAKSRPSGGLLDAQPALLSSATSSQLPSEPVSATLSKATTPRPPPIIVPPERKIKETYLISECAKSILKLAQDTIMERRELVVSGAFGGKAPLNTFSASSMPILMSSIPSIFDLFRALYAVSHANKMALSPALRIRLSNDCNFLSREAEKLSKAVDDVTTVTKLVESRERLDSLAERCFDDCLEEKMHEIFDTLRRGEGFTALSDDSRYALCQSAVENTMRKISSIGQDWKVTLTQTSYLEAMGFIVEETFSFILNDILSLPDIPELDSHRLNQLCLKLEALKEFFITSPGAESTVGTYVRSWFKFAYMAELLEASLADITYLFERGALIDFEVDELVRLIQGLFAETPLRAKTIGKISMGHPRADTVP